ncbi:MAG: ABC transporter substrate-binding protein [Rhizobiales bacterium]|jgi:ABC-type nitrate/sulfonate/bicarbonate transport system substrate-binding protein|nr:ABC transporter substrate-binding protein [Hyphomicrobiales bacterium]
MVRLLYVRVSLIVAMVLVTSHVCAADFKVVAFAGASNWPFWIGQEKGLFKAHSIEPVLDITPNSVEMAKNLYSGKYDLALTAIDNIIAYDEGQGEAPDVPANAGFIALFGVDNGMLSVMAKSDIGSIKELKGKTFSVDAMTTGFAFTQREMLKINGMTDADVNWVKVGGGAQRLEALLKGEQDATLLNSPLDLAAESKGFKRLIRITDELEAYQGIVGAARRDHAEKNRTTIIAFIRGFKASVDWLADPAHKEEALSIFMSRMKGMERPAAENAYLVLTDAKTGIYRDLNISAEGLKTVMRLRSEYAEPKKTLSDASRYQDSSYLQEALK